MRLTFWIVSDWALVFQLSVSFAATTTSNYRFLTSVCNWTSSLCRAWQTWKHTLQQCLLLIVVARTSHCEHQFSHATGPVNLSVSQKTLSNFCSCISCFITAPMNESISATMVKQAGCQPLFLLPPRESEITPEDSLLPSSVRTNTWTTVSGCGLRVHTPDSGSKQQSN